MPIHDWTRVYAGLFHDFHQSWSIRIKDSLNRGMLPKHMSALIEQRAGPNEADVLAVEMRDPISLDRPSRGGSTIMEPPATRIVRKSTKEVYADKANRIVVKHKLGRTVAVIEIVSPGNKDGRQSFQNFIEKSLDYMKAGIHLLVIDLFPPTKRDPFGVHRVIWDEFEEEDVEFKFPSGKDRIVASYNAGREKAAYVEPVAVGDTLPDMPLFLIETFYVQVPLEATYQETWAVVPPELQNYVLTGVAPGDADDGDE